jgi:hypothetical protein
LEVGRRSDLIFLKYPAILFSLFILAVVVAADTGIIGQYLKWLTFFGGDKIGHFALFGMLSLLINLALFQAFAVSDPKRVAGISGLLLALLIGAEEFSQNFFSTRTASWMDLAASYLGVVVFSLLALKMRRTPRV